jgi:hypothetical protein
MDFIDFAVFYYLSEQNQQAFLNSLDFITRQQYQNDYDTWFYDPGNSITAANRLTTYTMYISYCSRGSLVKETETFTVIPSEADVRQSLKIQSLVNQNYTDIRVAFTDAPDISCTGGSTGGSTGGGTFTLYSAYCRNGFAVASQETFSLGKDRNQAILEIYENLSNLSGVDPGSITTSDVFIPVLTKNCSTSPPPPPTPTTRTLYAAYCVQRLIPGLSSTQDIPTFPSSSTKIIDLTNVSAQQIQPFLVKQSQLFQDELRQSGATQIRLQFDSPPPNENCLPVDRELTVDNNYSTTLHIAYCVNGRVTRQSTIIVQSNLQLFLENRENLISQYYSQYKTLLDRELSSLGYTNLTIAFNDPPNISCSSSLPPTPTTRTLYAAYCVQRLTPGLSSTQDIPTFPSSSSKIIDLTNVSAQQIQPFLVKQSQVFQDELRQSGATQIRLQFDSPPPNENCLPVDRETIVTNFYSATLYVAYCRNGVVSRESKRVIQSNLQQFVDNRENLIAQYYKEYKEALEARFAITNLTIDFDGPPNIFCGGSVTLYAAYCIGEKAETKTKVVSLSPVTSEQMVQPFIYKNVELFKIELERLGAKKIEMSSLTMPDLPACNISGPSKTLFASFCSNGQSGTSSKEISLAGISNDKLSVFLASQAESYENALRSSGANPVFTNYDTPPFPPSCEGSGTGEPEGPGPSGPGPSGPGPTPPPPPTTTTTTTTLRIPDSNWLKRINPIDNRKYVFDITEGLFSNNVRNLVTFFTGSTSENYSRYYTHVYDENPKTSLTSSIQFSIAYGHSGGSGSLDEGNKINITPTRAIYSQYRNLVLGKSNIKFNLTGRETDSIYVINYQSKRLKDRLNAGVLELNIAHLSGSQFLAGGGTISTHTGSNVKLAGNNRVLRLIDDSKISTSPDYTDVGYSYNIVSGTLETGVYNQTAPHYYGKLIPSLGVVILDGNKLDLSASFATSKASEIEGYNAIKLYKSFSGSALVQDNSGDYLGMKARRVIREYNDYYFIRVLNNEYNFTNNPSRIKLEVPDFMVYKDADPGNPHWKTNLGLPLIPLPVDPTSLQGLEDIRRRTLLKLENGEISEPFVNNSQVYITTVGLYNAQRELIAVGKLPKPILKNFTEESIFTVKLKY